MLAGWECHRRWQSGRGKRARAANKIGSQRLGQGSDEFQ